MLEARRLFGFRFDKPIGLRIGCKLVNAPILVVFDPQPYRPSSRAIFATTHWSVVLKAGEESSSQAREALEELCTSYWHPLYAYIRKQGYSPPDAQDLTQEFFAHFLERKYFRAANRERGKFRSFLLVSLKHFLSHHWHKVRAAKRGGDRVFLSWDELAAENFYQSAGGDLKPEELYDQRWALTLLEKPLLRLRTEFAAQEKTAQFDRLKFFLSHEATEGAYAAAAAELGVSANAIGVMVHRLRQRYGEMVRREIAQTVLNPEDIEDELRYLISVMNR